MTYATEPSWSHGSASRTAVLLCNLGTPDAPTPAALRKYLAQFLSDPRVVEIPTLLWKPILHGIILRTRPAKSAAKYASIWTEHGSPLRMHTQAQADALQAWLQAQSHDVLVRPAMRYGNPSIPSQLDALKAAGARRVLILNAYPQYSGATTASAADAVFAWAAQVRHLPELRFVNRYHDDAGYIQALAQQVRAYWDARGSGLPEHLVMSFHGMPERTLHLGDPYHCECLVTGRLLAQALGLAPERWTVTFQSRFGRAKWLQPYTEPTLQALAKAGKRRVDIICPGFVADCLETLEEIALEGRSAFLTAGGEHLGYIPCLNGSAAWIDALGHITLRHLAGWPTQSESAEALQASRERALARGGS